VGARLLTVRAGEWSHLVYLFGEAQVVMRLLLVQVGALSRLVCW